MRTVKKWYHCEDTQKTVVVKLAEEKNSKTTEIRGPP